MTAAMSEPLQRLAQALDVERQALVEHGAVGALRQLGGLRSLFTPARRAVTMVAAGVTIGINWTIYVAAVTTGHVTEAALGYFMNPLATVIIGVVVLREKLRPLQWVAVAIAFLVTAQLTGWS